MRILASFFVSCFSISAFCVTIPELPQCDFADAEVSTNIAFAVERSAMTRIEFTVALDATPTNSVEVAIGTDANGDGNLSVEESAYVFGYDCGTWLCRELVANRIENIPVDLDLRSGPYLSHTFILKKHQLDTAWNLAKVTRRGCGATCEMVKADGKLPGFSLEVR